ncbi:MAG: hypothetical protein JXB15_15510 [Anaerolineales bacterium]|nr:hypothetical protein [Anaerolineales bacterium]
MTEEKRVYQADTRSVSGLKLQPRVSRDHDLGAGGETPYLLEMAKLPYGRMKFSREMILRLIDWFKES